MAECAVLGLPFLNTSPCFCAKIKNGSRRLSSRMQSPVLQQLPSMTQQLSKPIPLAIPAKSRESTTLLGQQGIRHWSNKTLPELDVPSVGGRPCFLTRQSQPCKDNRECKREKASTLAAHRIWEHISSTIISVDSNESRFRPYAQSVRVSET